MIKLELVKLSILTNLHMLCLFVQPPIHYNEFCEDIIYVIVNYEGIADSSAALSFKVNSFITSWQKTEIFYTLTP